MAGGAETPPSAFLFVLRVIPGGDVDAGGAGGHHRQCLRQRVGKLGKVPGIEGQATATGFQRSIVSRVPCAAIDNRLALELGDGGSTTAISKSCLNEPTLEKLIERLARESARVAYQPVRLDFGEGVYDGIYRARFRVNFAPEQPVECPCDGAVILIPRIEFDVGLRVNQSLV